MEISYTGLSYIESKQIQFKYRLEGLQADWVDAGTRRAAYFSYLPPGSYTFRVIAANSDGFWNNGGAWLNVVVRAPVWIKRTAGGAEITCKDNGQGFNPEASLRKGGMGLTSMSERVRMLGGRYTIESAVGKGATIRVTIDKTK